MSWLFIGAGNMASSLIGGLLASGKNAHNVGVVDPSQSACDNAISRFDVHAGSSFDEVMSSLTSASAGNNSTATGPLGIVLAVKPHIVQEACKTISGSQMKNENILTSALIVSVAAGVRAQSMQSWLPENSALIRCMPNTPALLGLGATALFANNHCQDNHKAQAIELLNAAGSTVWVDSEKDLDAVTALSGSGPAYFFYLIEHMIDAGVQLGLPKDTAEQLAIDTAYGAASMAQARELSPQVLRENVTSKGGTTAAALTLFNQQHTPKIIKAAMQAAHDRAVELGDALDSDPK